MNRFLKCILRSIILIGPICFFYTASNLSAAETFIIQTKRVSISTDTANPTQVLARDYRALKTCLINNTTNAILIGDANTTFHTSASTGTFRLPGTSSSDAVPFCLDGPNAPYIGQLYAVAIAIGPVNIDAIRINE